MVFCMKTILSFYEKKKDRVISDYLYFLCIPLVFVHGSQRQMHKTPADLISYFFTIQKMAAEFDPMVDLIVKHDDSYDALMTDQFMNSMNLIDGELTKHITEIIDLSLPQNRTLLVLLVKKFVHTLGFAFLNMRTTLFVWDQLFLKLTRNKMEIFVLMAILAFCLKPLLMETTNWDQFIKIFYEEAKQVPFKSFLAIYKDFYDSGLLPHYVPQYDIKIGEEYKKYQIDMDTVKNEMNKIQDQKLPDKVAARTKIIMPYFISEITGRENMVDQSMLSEAFEPKKYYEYEQPTHPEMLGVVPLVHRDIFQNDYDILEELQE